MAADARPESLNAPTACCGGDAPGPQARREAAPLTAAFRALGDETRLGILRALLRSERPLCECEIVPAFGLSQSTISYHLKVLREAELVEAERRGVWVYYRARPRALLGLVRELAALAGGGGQQSMKFDERRHCG